MSTKLEDLSDSSSESNYGIEPEELELEPVKQLEQKEILQTILNGSKRPVIVGLLMLFLGHPLLAQGVSKIPNIEFLTEKISIHFILSILAGIFFFIIDLNL